MDRFRIATLFGAVMAALLPGVTGAQTYTRTDVIVYHDNTSKWVLGQVASSTNTNTGLVEYATTYDATSALPLQTYAFGKLQQTLTYNANGTVATVKDGNNNVTTLSSWKRGIPQTIQHPATPEATLGAIQSAVVDNNGWISAVTDENGFTTSYTYDAMGRLKDTIYPTGDTTVWHATTRVFEPVAVAEYGIPAGHWRQTVSTGNARKITYFDGLWRPLLTKELDVTNGTTETLTKRFQRFSYDHDGRVAFASYPGLTDALTTGVWSTYDALGRATSVSQDSEQGLLTTLTQYQIGFETHVTDPKGAVTITRYMAFDKPVYEFPLEVQHPESAITKIERDVFGAPLSIARSGP